jgi:hypothetical protein
MYSEDLLSLAVSLTKDQMTKVIFPVVTCLSGESESHQGNAADHQNRHQPS